ncbi:MAG: acyl-CoA desaturase [Leucothrix sp.]
MYATAIVGGTLTFSWEALLVFLVTSAITLCLGHSLGMHRRLIHNSYSCPKWMEYLFVYLGVLVGLAGPLGMMKTHDLRDWAQRQPQCHDYFAHRSGMLRDWFWQLHCDIQLTYPPTFTPDAQVANSRFYRLTETYWMWQQLPLMLLLGTLGGISWIVWGICVRVAVSVTGHWLVGYFAHNQGSKHWRVEGAAVQGHNIKHLGLITMGECWHNNHHAFPESAKLGLHDNEVDPGWWVLVVLKKFGWVWNIKLPKDLADRPELKSLDPVKSKLNCNQSIQPNVDRISP